MPLANQSVCAEWMAKNAKNLQNGVYPVPVEID
jgi:hypothetical protein